MINIIIASYNEPNATLKAIKSFLNQDIKQNFNILVSDPFSEVKDFLKKNIRNKKLGFFLDPGEGKSYALNILLSKLFSKSKDDIIIFTDGDVYVSKNSVNEIIKKFEDKEVGVVTGHPVSINSKNNKFGYWSHLLFDGIHKVRKRKSENKEYFECSGYLFAIRNSIISEFPIDCSEDSIIPYLFWKKEYKIAYADKAEVYVLNPQNFKDWENQKIRNIKGHENLNKYVDEKLRTKSFTNEIKEGSLFALTYAKNLKQFFWTVQLFFSRLYIYLKAFKQIKNFDYQDGWRETEINSTKPLD